MSAESIAPSSDNTDGFTYQGKQVSQGEYLGETERGPLGEQFVPCPKCGELFHKFSIRCQHCGVVVREIGAIETGPRGSATKGIGFVVGILLFVLASMVLGERAYSSGGHSLGACIGLGAAGLLLGVNGLLGVLYFRYFALVTFLKGIAGFGSGVVSILLALLSLILLV